MKKILALLLAVAMVACLFAGCKPSEPSNGDDGERVFSGNYEDISDTCESSDGKYQVAFVTDVGQLKDKSFNQGTWEGVKRYAWENNKTYKYYQPANGSEATDDDRFNAMKAAVDGGAEIVICAGFLQETALKSAALAYPDVKFVFIDGYPLADDAGNTITNIAPIWFQEEQAGYLAGYAAVMEGFTKLGFSGGGGGANPACCRYGYGYLQGIQDAAKAKDVNVEVNYSWEYGASFSASADLQTMLNGWYTAGTEVIFACGGQMCQSAFAAAGANDAYVIGVDVDQSSESETVVTSAMKGLHEAVIYACETFYADKWDEIGGAGLVMGAAGDAVGLPVETWSLKNFSVEEYNALLASLKDGSVTVDDNYENLSPDLFPNITLNQI